MKFASVLASGLLATAAIAAPLTEERRARHERRLARQNRSSHPPYKPGTSEVIKLSKSKQVEYSSNWAGAVLIGNGYNRVTGTFVVPTPKMPSGGNSNTQYCASAWVGIDGDTCSSAILQTGVDFCVQGGSVSYDAWYEWYPDYAYDFSGISINAGDSITVSVDASSDTTGTATITNHHTGQSVTHTFNGGVDGDLCEYNAEWIVEDFESGGSLVPFANFGTVTFTSAYANGNIGPSGATLMDIEQNGKVLTSVSDTSSSVKVSYV